MSPMDYIMLLVQVLCRYHLDLSAASFSRLRASSTATLRAFSSLAFNFRPLETVDSWSAEKKRRASAAVEDLCSPTALVPAFLSATEGDWHDTSGSGPGS